MQTTRALGLLWPALSWTAVLLLAPEALAGNEYINESRTITGPPQSTTERFSFTREKDDLYPNFDFTVDMSRGRAELEIKGPDGRTLQTLGAKSLTLKDQPFVAASTPGTYKLEVRTTDAVGRWQLRVFGGPNPPETSIGPGLASGAAMLIVAGASVWWCRRRTHAAWRWFWVGAGLWTIAVAVKFAIAIPLNKPLLEGLKSSSPYWVYITLGTIYGGAMTGLTEVLFVYLAGFRWRQMSATAERAAAIGVGAGAFEAALLAIAAVAVNLAGGAGGATWAVALAPAVERIIAILCHVAARMLALLGVARQQQRYFWYGFLLLCGVDAAAMYLILTGKIKTMSPWITEAIIALFGLASIPIIAWCTRNWPAREDDP
jgi:uncharacterized membrane protein YhfC